MDFIPPKYDGCMKELFRNKKVLKYFIGDVLGIPIEEFRSVRLKNTFLWRKYRSEKLGILDVLAQLGNGMKINIEMQLKMLSYWDKRQMFYLSKMYTEDLYSGDGYTRLKRCVGISILDYNLTEGTGCHNTYYLMDREGRLFSDVFEVHTLELRKEPMEGEAVGDWIRLFNVTCEEELRMIKTKNAGILEAIKEVWEMNLKGRLRIEYEAYMKMVRDKEAIEDYARKTAIKEGREQGIQEGRLEGIQEGRREGIQEGRREGIQEGRLEGVQEGIVQGEERMSHLIQLLLRDSRQEDIVKAVDDRNYRESLFGEFGI